MAQIPLQDLMGLATLHAAAGTTVVYSLGRAAGLPGTIRTIPTAFAALPFLALTQLPLPDPGALARACPLPSTKPNVVPFAFVPYVIDRWQEFGAVQTFVMEWSAVVYAMNFLLCGLIGLVASRHGLRTRTAALLGLGLSLAAELTQFTGLWGLYPCAWRKFDVDDLILNTAGVAAGVLLGTRLRRGWRAGDSRRSPHRSSTTPAGKPRPGA